MSPVGTKLKRMGSKSSKGTLNRKLFGIIYRKI